MTIPEKMKAMVTMGHGDFDKLVWHEDWPVPVAASGEVLVRVGACGLNNTDINTRTGWYSKAVSEATTGGAYDAVGSDDPSWGGAAVTFPRIQGADVCGEIVAVGDSVDPARIGERVITDNWLRDPAAPLDKTRTGYFGSERDGGQIRFFGCRAGDIFLLLFNRRGHADPRQCPRQRHGACAGGIGRCRRRAGAVGKASRRARHRHGIRGETCRGCRAWRGQASAAQFGRPEGTSRRRDGDGCR